MGLSRRRRERGRGEEGAGVTAGDAAGQHVVGTTPASRRAAPAARLLGSGAGLWTVPWGAGGGGELCQAVCSSKKTEKCYDHIGAATHNHFLPPPPPPP